MSTYIQKPTTTTPPPPPKKKNSDTNMFQRYLRSNKTQICLAVTSQEQSFSTLVLSLFFTNVCLHPKNEGQMSIFSRHIEVPRIFKESMPGAGMFQANTLLACFINADLHAQNQSQTLILLRDIDDQIILKSHWLRACQGKSYS